MAGTSHNHTMNIGIRVDASGIGKTDSELKNLSNEINGLNGKKLDLQVNMGDKASKTIDTITSSIGKMENSLNNISTRGIQGIQDAVSGATKSIDSLTSAIGSIQKSLDTINAKGIQDVSSAMGDVTKSSADASSGVGGLSTAIATVNIGNLEEVASALGNIQTAAQDAGSSIAQAMETSGFTDNWNNSYGGRYGGMRYTGQGIGLGDIVSAISNGKSSYELTVENAMNKTRNMAVAKSWTPEDGVSGMDAYWALDAATNHSLMSLNTLAAGINATAATTGASAKDIKGHARDFADFGTMVMGLGYTEDVAQTAVMKLGRGLHGTFAALDQYGITQESLTNTGLWNGDENDFDGYMAAVSAYSKLMSTQLLSTATGQMATLSKSASLGGYALGQIEAEATQGLAAWYQGTDDWLRRTTQKMGWGADVRDNAGQRVLYRIPKDSEGNPIDYIDYNDNGVYDEGTDEAMGESVYVTADERIVDDMGRATDYANEAQAIADGFSQKKTGFSLSTLLIGADQVIGTYKTIKDTILGAYAEWRDLKRIKQIGLKNIFSGDEWARDAQGNLYKVGQDGCNQMKEGCAKAKGKEGIGENSKNKKKGLLGRTKDKIGNTVNNTKNRVNDKINNIRGKGNQKDFSILNPSSSGNTSRLGKLRDKISNKINNNPHSIISNPDFKGYDKPVELKRKPVEKYNPQYLDNSGKASRKGFNKYETEKVTKNGMRYNKFKVTPDTERYNQIHGPDYVKKEGSSSAKFLKPYESNTKMTPAFERMKRESELRTKTKNLNKDLDSKNKQVINSKDSRYSGLTNKVSSKIEKTKNNISSKRNGLSNYFSSDNKARETAGNKYDGYMKRVNKGIFDTKTLKTKAKSYLNTKKGIIQKEFADGQLNGLIKKKIYGDKARAAPYKAWESVKNKTGNIPSIKESSAYQSLQTRGSNLKNNITSSGAYKSASNLKNTITGSGAYKSVTGAGTTLKNQVVGNAKAIGGMTGLTPMIQNSRAAQKVNTIKQQGAKTTVGNAASRVGGAARTAGGTVLRGASTGMGAVAGGIGKIGGLMGGIMGGLGAILGPVGMILMAVTLITGLLDAMGVDWMGPLQTAFGGFIEALQPAIQGFGTWLQDTAEALGPILTQIGQVLGPVLQALGGLISGGLGALGQVLGPIVEGFLSIFGGGSGAGMFDGLAEGLEGLGPILSQIWDLMGQGAGAAGGFFGGILDGVGEYLTHIVQELANTISMFWNTLAQGISTAIQTIGNGIMIAISGIITTIGTASGVAIAVIGAAFGAFFALVGAGIGAGIAAIGIGTGVAIIGTLGALGAGIAAIGVGIALAIASIGISAGTSIAAIGIGIGAAIASAGMKIAMVITAISTAVTTGVNMMATAITSGITMISDGILAAFTGFATTVATTTEAAYMTLLAFQGTAVSLMGTIATDMVNNFKNNFHGVKEGVDAEMSGAYDALCYWGDLMVAEAERIGQRMKDAMLVDGMGTGSPGYIWLGVRDEFQGAWNSMVQKGAGMVNSARTIGSRVVGGYNEGYNSQSLDMSGDLPSTPTVNTGKSNPMVDVPTTPPKVEVPQVAQELKENNKQQSNNDQPTQLIFNHYGDLDSEERANNFLKYVSSKMGFENKRANRTVNRGKTTTT